MAEVNPYRNASPWGSCLIGDESVGGIIQAIDGALKPDDWTFQKGTSGNNAVSIWNGTKLAESIKITIYLFSSTQYDQYETCRRRMRPKAGEKPPSLPVVNPVINGAGVAVVAHRSSTPPKWVRSGGYWIGEIEVCEFNPAAPAKAGQAGGAQYQQGSQPKETAAERQLRELAEEARKL